MELGIESCAGRPRWPKQQSNNRVHHYGALTKRVSICNRFACSTTRNDNSPISNGQTLLIHVSVGRGVDVRSTVHSKYRRLFRIDVIHAINQKTS